MYENNKHKIVQCEEDVIASEIMSYLNMKSPKLEFLNKLILEVSKKADNDYLIASYHNDATAKIWSRIEHVIDELKNAKVLHIVIRHDIDEYDIDLRFPDDYLYYDKHKIKKLMEYLFERGLIVSRYNISPTMKSARIFILNNFTHMYNILLERDVISDAIIKFVKFIVTESL